MQIGFIGTGKISGAVIEAFCNGEMHDIEIFLSPRNSEKSMELAGRYPRVTRMSSNQEVLDASHIVFIALKPDVCREPIRLLDFRPDHTVISLIPYLGFDELSSLVAPAGHICRAIPLPTVVNHVCPVPVFRPNAEVSELLGRIGQPLVVKDEKQLHTIWTLTGLISPFYDLLAELSRWTTENGVEKSISDKYVADLFNSLSHAASVMESPDFSALSHHAATPGGMNERSGKEIAGKNAHKAYRDAADEIMKKFQSINPVT